MLAALGTSQLQGLGQFVERRADLVDRYRDALSGMEGIRLLGQRLGTELGRHLFPVRVLDDRRRDVVVRMRDAGIGVQVHYLPVHRHPVWEDIGYRAGSCPVAEAAYEELISLPLFPAMRDADVDRVVTTLQHVLR